MSTKKLSPIDKAIWHIFKCLVLLYRLKYIYGNLKEGFKEFVVYKFHFSVLAIFRSFRGSKSKTYIINSNFQTLIWIKMGQVLLSKNIEYEYIWVYIVQTDCQILGSAPMKEDLLASNVVYCLYGQWETRVYSLEGGYPGVWCYIAYVDSEILGSAPIKEDILLFHVILFR